MEPSARCTSTSTVGYPRESKISLAKTRSIGSHILQLRVERKRNEKKDKGKNGERTEEAGLEALEARILAEIRILYYRA
jgi:hypothetical protein